MLCCVAPGPEVVLGLQEREGEETVEDVGYLVGSQLLLEERKKRKITSFSFSVRCIPVSLFSQTTFSIFRLLKFSPFQSFSRLVHHLTDRQCKGGAMSATEPEHRISTDTVFF